MSSDRLLHKTNVGLEDGVHNPPDVTSRQADPLFEQDEQPRVELPFFGLCSAQADTPMRECWVSGPIHACSEWLIANRFADEQANVIGNREQGDYRFHVLLAFVHHVAQPKETFEVFEALIGVLCWANQSIEPKRPQQCLLPSYCPHSGARPALH
jgi:hypothetical protein